MAFGTDNTRGNDLAASALTALRLSTLPRVLEAKKVIRDFFYLPRLPADNPEALGSLDAAIDETTFAAMLAIAGSDPMNPQLAMYETMPYSVLGQNIPGSRYGFDNGDRAFRHFFVNAAYRYEIHGRRPVGSASTNLVLEACEDKPPGWGYPLTFLHLKDLAIDPDGTFVINVNSDGPTGHKNHLWLPPGAAHVLIRDTYLDWGTELPTELTVRRVTGPAAVVPVPFEALARQAPAKVIEHAMNSFKWHDWGVAPVAMNSIPPPLVRPAPPGEVPWGMTGVGRFQVAAGEAMVFTLDALSARYLGVMITTPWMVGIDFVNRTGSLNISQVVPNPDGTITYVIAATDPGTPNWLDTAGVRQGEMLIRWELLRSMPDPKAAVLDVRVVPLANVATSLPFAMPAVTREQRREQIEERRLGYGRRLSALLLQGEV